MSDIDLTLLPAPDAVEAFDFETIFARRKARLIELCPAGIRQAVAATLELESEPLTIDLQQQAYQEILLRQRINEAARAGMLAFAGGADLDHIGALRGLARKTIRPANPRAVPPVEAVYESDTDFRRRIQLHPEKYAAAGPAAAYVAHALDAHADVADAQAVRVRAGTVRVYVKSYSGGGVPAQAVLNAVINKLSGENVRPLCDTVEVQAARKKEVRIEYEAEYLTGPDKDLIKQAQRQALNDLAAKSGKIGGFVALSKIIGALDMEGVHRIRLISPTADVACQDGEFIVIAAVTAREA